MIRNAFIGTLLLVFAIVNPCSAQGYIQSFESPSHHTDITTSAVSIPDSVMAQGLHPVIWLMIVLVSGILAGSIVCFVCVSHWPSKPIKILTTAIQKVDSEHLDIQLPTSLTRSTNDVGILANTFINMTQNLKSSMTSIETINRTNEQLQDRERQLQEANEQLEKNEIILRENMIRLKRFSQLAAKREFKMRELKMTINKLLEELGRDKQYKDDQELSDFYTIEACSEVEL